MGKFQLITKGLVKENPTFVLLLGMCPTLATTTSAINGMSMGLATMFVLILSNMAISAIAGLIPDKVRISASEDHNSPLSQGNLHGSCNNGHDP